MTWRLEEETPEDIGPIHELNCLAFGRPDEAELVQARDAATDLHRGDGRPRTARVQRSWPAWASLSATFSEPSTSG